MDCRENKNGVTSLYRREAGSVSNKSELTFTSLLTIGESAKPPSPVNASFHENHKSFPQTAENSHLIHTVDSPNTKSFIEAGAYAKFNASNNTSSFENNHLMKRRSEKSGVHSGTNSSRSVSYKGPVKIIKSENKVNTTRALDVLDTTKYVIQMNGSDNIVGKASGNVLTTEYDQSWRVMPTTQTKSVRKKSKNRVKSGSSGKNSTVKSLSNKRAKKLSKVSLLGLFEMTTHLGKTRWEGKSELAAAKLAVKHINERRLINGYVLDLITNDTQVCTRIRTNESRLHA